jgi:uncharacterized OsmC-like protein
MRMLLESELGIRLEVAGHGFEIASEGIAISPYHLLAGSLASCIALLVVPWAERSGIALEPATISISWEHTEDGDNRVKHIEVDVRWPGLPDSRQVVVERLAEACPIHATLISGTMISSRVRVA